jgi:transcriptional regulator with XRE-family HTH domain
MGERWRRTIQEYRERLGLSRAELARRASLSGETVRAYEDGRRHPTVESLKALLDALSVPTAEARAALEDAGLVVPATLFPLHEHPNYYFSLDELPDAVELVPWPEFVLNENLEVVAANTAVQRLWGIDYEEERARRAPAQMSLLSVANDRRFTEHVLNWEECVATIASVFKSHPRHGATLDEPTPYLEAVLAEVLDGDPQFLRRLGAAWEAAPPREAKCRWQYRVAWREEGVGDMRFLCLVTTASEPDALGFNDWIPTDAETWTALEAVKRRRG